MPRSLTNTGTAAGLFMVLLGLAGCGEPAADVGLSSVAATFVGRGSCVECHEQQTLAFTGSDHDLAMQPATAETVLGDFNDASFTHAGITSTFYRHGDEFIVRTDGPDGELQEFTVSHTFGVRPLQQYLVELDSGRYQVLRLSWDSRTADEGGQRWFQVYGDEHIDHTDELHWTNPLQNWNFMCAECHSTRLDKGYVAGEGQGRFETTWSEIDVSCEACHGPGSGHVQWAHNAEAGKTPTDATLGLSVRLKAPNESYWAFDEGAQTAHRVSPIVDDMQVETCARCHSRRGQVWGEYQHGQPLADTHRVALLDENLYHADGQILDEVYVYGSFLQSKMYHKGVRCTDCHEPHSAGLVVTGNALCIRCHQPDVFDTPEHHFHPAGSPGAQCVQCHMPERSYMEVDPRRDHSLRVPRPDLSVKVGTPNACTGCHEDQSASWASEWVTQWYGTERSSQPHFAEAFEPARAGLPGAREKLLPVVNDAETPAIVRATAVELLRAYPGERSTATVASALQDDDPLVRRAGVGMLDTLSATEALRLGEPLLADPVRTVRLEAAMTLAGLIQENPENPGPFDRAVAEYRESLWFNADRAEAHLSLGILEMRLGDAAASEAAYRAALTMHPDFAPASINLADLFRATGRDAEGERVLRASLAARESGAAHHALGLLLIRTRQHTEALGHLAAAVTQSPEDPRFAYVFAVATHDLGDAPKAIVVLEQAHRLHPSDRDLLTVLILYCRELGRDNDAQQWTERLRELVSG